MSYRQMELLYEKIYNISMEINRYIETEDYELILPAVNRREQMSVQLSQMLKQLPDKQDYPETIKEYMRKLKTQELKNMENLVEIKNKIKFELDKMNKDSKLLAAYIQNDVIDSKMVDITE